MKAQREETLTLSPDVLTVCQILLKHAGYTITAPPRPPEPRRPPEPERPLPVRPAPVDNEPRGPRFIRWAELRKMTGLSRSTVSDWIRAGRFPKQIRLSGRFTVWSSQEVEAWMDERKQDRGDKAVTP